jgi:hypothetical protein
MQHSSMARRQSGITGAEIHVADLRFDRAVSGSTLAVNAECQGVDFLHCSRHGVSSNRLDFAAPTRSVDELDQLGHKA